MNPSPSSSSSSSSQREDQQHPQGLSSSSSSAVSSIIEQDRIIVRNQYLVYQNDITSRFYTRGIAFPVPLHYDNSHIDNANKNDKTHHDDFDDESGWISILKQLRKASPYLNTIRLYRLPPSLLSSIKSGSSSTASGLLSSNNNNNITTTKNNFIEIAAELGFYILLPFTDVSGKGVLDQSLIAPKCYTRKLYEYGKQIIDHVAKYPNILAGVVGNEVMNSIEHWKSAPCLLAYTQDLKLYMKSINVTIPFMYTTQHDGIGAVISPAQHSQLALEYLTSSCVVGSNSSSSNEPLIDIFGINIESWCSSLQSFEQNEDGSIGTFYDLYQHLQNSTTVPIIFSEMGCSRILFDRDNGMRHNNIGHVQQDTATDTSSSMLGIRSWHEVSVVEQNMSSIWSGYIAYAYDGPTDFRMTIGSRPWDGHSTLNFNQDMKNYLEQIEIAATTNLHFTTMTDYSLPTTNNESCAISKHVQQQLNSCCNLNLFPLNKMPTYYNTKPNAFESLKDWFITNWIQGGGDNDDKIGIKNVAEILAFRHPSKNDSSHLGIVVLGIIVILIVTFLPSWKERRRSKHPALISNTTSRDNYYTFA